MLKVAAQELLLSALQACLSAGPYPICSLSKESNDGSRVTRRLGLPDGGEHERHVAGYPNAFDPAMRYRRKRCV
jgi:hypothetical protein